MIIPSVIPPRQKLGIGVMEPIKSLCEADMVSLAPKSKITGKHSLRLVISSFIYVLMSPTNYSLYEAPEGQLYAEGLSVEINTQSMQ